MFSFYTLKSNLHRKWPILLNTNFIIVVYLLLFFPHLYSAVVTATSRPKRLVNCMSGRSSEAYYIQSVMQAFSMWIVKNCTQTTAVGQ